ncbi:hypothetical protein BC832DRAFT_539740 [Gaertneriomyces semiglobifer]|nr:hypothetical protein BC832DRAFT_539740 [Gaertneriomyces semiglobifer]
MIMWTVEVMMVTLWGIAALPQYDSQSIARQIRFGHIKQRPPDQEVPSTASSGHSVRSSVLGNVPGDARRAGENLPLRGQVTQIGTDLKEVKRKVAKLARPVRALETDRLRHAVEEGGAGPAGIL